MRRRSRRNNQNIGGIRSSTFTRVRFAVQFAQDRVRLGLFLADGEERWQGLSISTARNRTRGENGPAAGVAFRNISFCSTARVGNFDLFKWLSLACKSRIVNLAVRTASHRRGWSCFGVIVMTKLPGIASAPMHIVSSRLAALTAAVAFAASLSATAMAETTVRIGHFPNITHVQGLVAHNLSRQGKGWFEPRLGNDVKIEWYVYNAGPSAMEAIFAKSIDFTYVGPNPAINAYFKSNGLEGRIVAGSVNGGSALVVQGDSTLKTPADFRGKKIATPQFGNTQDVAARAWLVAGGLTIRQNGGDAQVIPTANPDQLSLFSRKQIDAVWTVEPWISRLEKEAGGKVLVDDRDAITTVLVARSDLLENQKELVRKLVAAHRELTEWIKANPAEAQRLAREELDAETHTKFSQDLVVSSWKRIVLTSDASLVALKSFISSAQSVGFLRNAPDLSRLVESP
jgi:NitT/TauT family transport system substrate-binding protein